MKGRSVKVQVSTNGTTWNDVAGLNSASHSTPGNLQETSEFGQDWAKRIYGLLDGTWSLAGNYRPDDTNGQMAIRNALLNDSELHVRVLWDGTNGVAQPVKVESFEVSAEAAGIVEVSIELAGDGPITPVP